MTVKENEELKNKILLQEDEIEIRGLLNYIKSLNI